MTWDMRENITMWFRENADRLFILVGLVLVGILSFEAGVLKGRVYQATPLVLSVPERVSGEVEQRAASLSGSVEKVSQGEPVVFQKEGINQCLFVGSKNSNKYHLSTCAVAKRIKPENRVCFASQEEAKKKGYLASCLK